MLSFYHRDHIAERPYAHIKRYAAKNSTEQHIVVYYYERSKKNVVQVYGCVMHADIAFMNINNSLIDRIFVFLFF